jgi:hypothetical protein
VTRSCWTWLKESIKLASTVRPRELNEADGPRGCGEEVFMSAQPNLITPSELSHSLREAPVSQQHAARFLNMHPKTAGTV